MSAVTDALSQTGSEVALAKQALLLLHTSQCAQCAASGKAVGFYDGAPIFYYWAAVHVGFAAYYTYTLK